MKQLKGLEKLKEGSGILDINLNIVINLVTKTSSQIINENQVKVSEEINVKELTKITS